MDSYCTAPGCDDSTRQGRAYCDFHRRRLDRGKPLTAPKKVRLNPRERLHEAALAWADADAENEAAYQKAATELLKAARAMAPQVAGDVIRQGMAEARQRGVRLGHPPRLTHSEALQAVSRHGSLKAAVRAGVASRNALRRALRRGPESGIANPSRRAA
jgi:hypothetical protein